MSAPASPLDLVRLALVAAGRWYWALRLRFELWRLLRALRRLP